MGTFFKQIYRYTRPRCYRHNENLWPYIKIERGDAGHISALSFRHRSIPIADLSALQGSQSGDVLLIASGPSVSETNFTPLQHLPVMGVNGAWSLRPVGGFCLYVIVDMTFFDQRLSLVKDIVSDPQVLLFTTVHGIVKLATLVGMDSVCCRLAVIEDACVKTYQPQVRKEDVFRHFQSENGISFSAQDNNIAFSQDIRQGIFDAGTVVYWALQILQYLGYHRIIIAGLDMNNFHQPRFYENEKNAAPSHLASQFEHVIEPGFIHASSVLQSMNIEVLNLSLNSALGNHIFRKVKSDDI